MPRKTQEQMDHKVLADINGENPSRVKEAAKIVGKFALVGALTTTGVFGVVKSPESTDSSEIGQGAGQTAGAEFVPQKGGDVITDDQGNQLQIIRDKEGNFVEFRNMETGETSQAEISSNPPVEIQNPFAEGNDGHRSAETERETSEQAQPFIIGNDGHKAANIEREANNLEG